MAQGLDNKNRCDLVRTTTHANSPGNGKYIELSSAARKAVGCFQAEYAEEIPIQHPS